MKILGYEVNKLSLNLKRSSKQDLRNYNVPVNMQRARQDVGSWVAALHEAELPYFPHRVKMQRLYNNTINNGIVYSAWERRKDLTLLRDFKICNDTDTEDEDWSAFFAKPWFTRFLSYALDAGGFGYSLISLGDIVNSGFPDLTILPRLLVSPDRKIYSRFEYMVSGANFLEAPFKDWHIYVSTPSDLGVSCCGYGLFHKVALYEIFLRHNLSFNADFNEIFGQPIRKGKTSKTDEDERSEFAAALQSMGSSGWIMLDDMDDVELIEAKSAGQGFKTYDNMESRMSKVISKLILGHSDALDSVPGKLGAGQAEDNPVYQALQDKQTKDGGFVEDVVNSELLPRLRILGFPIPPQLKFKFKNDAELEEIRSREDASNKVTAEIAQVMKNAGLQMDPKYFTERTGIPAEKIEEPAPLDPKASKEASANIKNKLNKIYGHNH